MLLVAVGFWIADAHWKERVSTPVKSSGQPSPRALPKVRTSYFNEFEGSVYHVYAKRIDWDRPVGVLYYFGGDYFDESSSEVFHPRGKVMRNLAEQAARRNLVTVVPVPPSGQGDEGYTWWEQDAANAEWFRSLSEALKASIGAASADTWLMGYSGGAEFITYRLLADHQPSYGYGGAIMVGGGGRPNTYVNLLDPFKSTIQLTWVVGENDTAGATNPPDWSAYDAAENGASFYEGEGFAHTSLQIVPRSSHTDYDLASILDESLDRAGIERVRRR